MNEEEKKAIETLKSWKDYNIKNKNKLLNVDKLINIQELILNLIEKLQKENEMLRLQNILYKNYIHELKKKKGKYNNEL